jgi:hypothetical protein
MINVLDLSEKYTDQWIVLDRSQKIVDAGPDLQVLWRKHGRARFTYYFASPVR